MKKYLLSLFFLFFSNYSFADFNKYDYRVIIFEKKSQTPLVGFNASNIVHYGYKPFTINNQIDRVYIKSCHFEEQQDKTPSKILVNEFSTYKEGFSIKINQSITKNNLIEVSFDIEIDNLLSSEKKKLNLENCEYDSVKLKNEKINKKFFIEENKEVFIDLNKDLILAIILL